MHGRERGVWGTTSRHAGASSSSRSRDVGELVLSVHHAGEGPAVVMCHGFPELAYSWRHQLPALVGAGFRVIAPDQRGYGGSGAPSRVEDYDLLKLSGDLVGLLDALEIEKAVFSGHDWGGFVAWAMPVLHPDRCLGVIGVNTPYVAFPTTDMLRAVFPDPEKMYMLWFQQVGVAEGSGSVTDPLPRRGGHVQAPAARVREADAPRPRACTRARSRSRASSAPSSGTATSIATSSSCPTWAP